MMPLHLLRLHYPCAGQGAGPRPVAVSSGSHWWPHRSVLLCKSCGHEPRDVGQQENRVEFAADGQENPCLQSFMEARNKMRKRGNI